LQKSAAIDGLMISGYLIGGSWQEIDDGSRIAYFSKA
jgi:hypothetical protein